MIEVDKKLKETYIATAQVVWQQLIEQYDYTDEELPSEETIRVKINAPGYRLRPVRKSQPQKSSRNGCYL